MLTCIYSVNRKQIYHVNQILIKQTAPKLAADNQAGPSKITNFIFFPPRPYIKHIIMLLRQTKLKQCFLLQIDRNHFNEKL